MTVDFIETTNKRPFLGLILFIIFWCAPVIGMTFIGTNLMLDRKRADEKVIPTVAYGSTDSLKSTLDKVRQSFLKIEKQDQELIYKMIAGASDYLKNAESLSSTSQFDPVLSRVQSSYGWNREKYPEFTDAVSNYLISAGYEEPKELSSKEDRLKFAKIFEDLEESIK